METEDTQQSPATVTGRAVTISVWLVVMLVGYMASIGPAVWIFLRFELPGAFFDVLYFPLMWLYFCDPDGWFGRSYVLWTNWWAALAQR